MSKRIEATLKLFNAIQIDKKTTTQELFLEKTVPYGFVLSPTVATIANDQLIKAMADYYLSTQKANQAFHKSWSTIENTPQEKLWMQAIFHYITTYGYEFLGIEGKIYIPKEILDTPNDIKLIVVKGLTAEEIKKEIIKLADGVALAQDTLNAIVEIVEHNQFRIEDKIQNRELKALLYDLYNLVPQEPVEYLRFIITKLTGESLIIKNDYLIDKIKSADSKLHRRTLDNYLLQSPSNLAEIFFRYKPLFLALKTVSNNKTFFNKLRKKANTIHKPLPEDYLNSITDRIKKGRSIQRLEEKLKTVSVFRRIRLANALKFRMSNPTVIAYKIRNGRSWVEDFVSYNTKELEEAYQVVLTSLKKKKTVYVPEYVDYAVPATEKQFIGHLPADTSVQVNDDLVVGIYWENVDGKRIDLDLSAVGIAGKTGWDSYYTSDSGDLLFSGDMIDAENGASELFYIKKTNVQPNALFINYYNYDSEVKVKAKILVAHEKPVNFRKNYVANNIIIQSDIVIDKKQSFIGLIYGSRFYFNHSAVGNYITSESSKIGDKLRRYLVSSSISSLRLGDIFTVLHEKGDYPDLSPEKISKNTILDLIKRL